MIKNRGGIIIQKYNDNELLYLIYENDDLATELLIDKYKPLILSSISKLNLTKEEKEEFYAEGLIYLVKAIHSYNERFFMSFNSYFTLILKRRFIKKKKKKSHKTKIVYLDNIEEFIVDNSNKLENQILREDKILLSAFERRIYELKFINNETPRKIAKELNCEVKKIYDAIDRIRKKLRKNNLNG